MHCVQDIPHTVHSINFHKAGSLNGLLPACFFLFMGKPKDLNDCFINSICCILDLRKISHLIDMYDEALLDEEAGSAFLRVAIG